MLYVRCTGEVLLCCNMETVIGNLDGNNFQDIWMSEEAENYRKGILDKKPYKHCAQCKYYQPGNIVSYIKYE